MDAGCSALLYRPCSPPVVVVVDAGFPKLSKYDAASSDVLLLLLLLLVVVVFLVHAAAAAAAAGNTEAGS